MGGKSSSATTGYRYFLAGVHAVVCMGVADYIKQLRADGKTAWSGENDGTTTISINRPDLFGGDAQEGGWVGDIDVLPGGPAQTTNTTLTDQRGTNIPAYRRVTSLVFKSFNFGANNPYFKAVLCTGPANLEDMGRIGPMVFGHSGNPGGACAGRRRDNRVDQRCDGNASHRV